LDVFVLYSFALKAP